MTRLIVGTPDKICSNCPGGITRMDRLPMTNTWICSICSGTEYWISEETILNPEEEED